LLCAPLAARICEVQALVATHLGDRHQRALPRKTRSHFKRVGRWFESGRSVLPFPLGAGPANDLATPKPLQSGTEEGQHREDAPVVVA
jgi:hypothetical protein